MNNQNLLKKIIIALNKADKYNDNKDILSSKREEIENNLLSNGIIIEKFGGEIPVIEISALKILE